MRGSGASKRTQRTASNYDCILAPGFKESVSRCAHATTKGSRGFPLPPTKPSQAGGIQSKTGVRKTNMTSDLGLEFRVWSLGFGA